MAIYSWLNPLFLWPFSIAFCMFTRRYLQMARYFHREHDDQLATRSPGEFCILLQPLDIWDSSPQNTSEFPGLGDFTLACLSSVHFNYPWTNQYRYDSIYEVQKMHLLFFHMSFPHFSRSLYVLLIHWVPLALVLAPPRAPWRVSEGNL